MIAATTNPGTMIPIRILLIDISPIAPHSTASALGGINMASPPLPMIGPRVIGFL